MRVHTKVVVQMTNQIGEYLPVSEEGYDYSGPVASCDPATIIGVISLAIGAGGTAYSIYNQTQQTFGNKPSTTPTPLTTPQNASQAAAVGQPLPTLQSLTGGSVSPEYAAQYGATQAGVANDPQATGNIQNAVNQFFGLSAPGSTGLTAPTPAGGGSDIISLLSKSKPPTPSGGGSEVGNDFVNQLLQSDAFRGLAG